MRSYLSCCFIFLCYVFLFIIIGISTTSQAEESNCSNRNVGEIRLSNGRKIPEVSGITRRAPGDVYLVSDRTRWLYHARLSGDRWSVDRYAISSEGYGPNSEGIYDIEDVAYGPCPVKSEGQCIFIGEIGGNPGGKNVFKIHYIRERDLIDKRGRYVKTTFIRYRYPGGWNFDAEGLAVHPRTGELFVVTKTRGSSSYIYKMDPRFPEQPPTRVIKIDLAALFGNNTNARQITGFEISPDGSRFAVVTYEALVEFNLDLSKEENVSGQENYRKLPGNTEFKKRDVLGDWWGTGTNIHDVQVESITYDGSNSNFLIIGEGNAAVKGLNCSEPSSNNNEIPDSLRYTCNIKDSSGGVGNNCQSWVKEGESHKDIIIVNEDAGLAGWSPPRGYKKHRFNECSIVMQDAQDVCTSWRNNKNDIDVENIVPDWDIGCPGPGATELYDLMDPGSFAGGSSLICQDRSGLKWISPNGQRWRLIKTITEGTKRNADSPCYEGSTVTAAINPPHQAWEWTYNGNLCPK